jgi:acyl carrier protein
MTVHRIWRYRRGVKNRHLDHNLLLSHLKNLVAGISGIAMRNPDEIADGEPLMGGGLGLDSLDTLELAICIEEEFGVAICGETTLHRAFTSIAHLADFIHAGALTSPVCRLRSANSSRGDTFRPVTMAWRPVFSTGAILTF